MSSTIIHTQNDEDSGVTVDSILSLETSKFAKDVANQHETIGIEKEPAHNVADDTVEITLDENVVEVIVVDDIEIVSLGSIIIHEVMEDVLSGPESIIDDEIMQTEIPPITNLKPIHMPQMPDVQESATKELVSQSSPSLSDPVCHLPQWMDYLAAHNIAYLIYFDTVKNQFPHLINEFIKENLSGLNGKIRRFLKTKMPYVLEESLKTDNKQFYALNKLECSRFAQLEMAIRNVREVHDLASKKKGAHINQLLKNLKSMFKWVTITAKKLKIHPSRQLTKIKLTSAEKKRKRKMEVVWQVVLDKEVMVDGTERNLAPPPGILTGKHGQVIEHPKPGILFFNGNTDLEF
ncbi:hypothetical protein Tco_0088222 [Tanacetum coccineum]